MSRSARKLTARETICNPPYDRKPRWRGAAACVSAGVLAFVLGRLTSFVPQLLEGYYVNGLGAWLAGALSAVSGVAPFSVFEPLILFIGCWLVLPGMPAAYAVATRRRSFANAVACGFARTAMFAGVLTGAFYLFWGLNYSRAALPARLGWDDAHLAALPRLGEPADRDELVALCTQLVFITNYYYETATGTRDDVGHSEQRTSAAEMDIRLDEGYVRAARLLHLHASFAATRGPAKPILASRVLSDLGIAGFYSPWTGEANYNREIPPFQLPLTIAHEKAHQRCVASEDEANFFGFLACVLSDDPYARYAGYLFAQRQLLRELLKIDPAAARAIIALRCKGVQSDVIYSKLFSRIFSGPAQALSHGLNDTYLKANRVDGGMLSYQMSARLLVLFARHNDGSCVVVPEPGPMIAAR